jgi:hypothetical protein
VSELHERVEPLEDEEEKRLIRAAAAVFTASGARPLQVARLEWVVVADAVGRDLAVRGKADFTVFPIQIVAKRYPTRERGFFAPILEAIAGEYQALAP